MYDQLYNTWKLEIEKTDLEKLPTDFYSNITEYVKHLREESRMLEKRATKANLLNEELRNTKRMISQLVRIRHRKIVLKLAKGEELPQEFLTPEEKEIYSTLAPVAEAVRSFAKDIVRGQLPTAKVEEIHKRVAIRFLKEVPAIIGADMRTYGPFQVEDLATLPLENTKILIKQGLAEKVEAG
jgi:DNA replication factor GINS